MGRKILIGCGALSILGVVGIGLLVAVAIFAAGPTETANAPEQEEAAEAEETPAAIGEVAEIGEVSWMVTSAEQTDVLTQEFGDDRTGNFVVVDFEFANNSDERVFLDTWDMSIVGSQGRESETDSGTFGFVPDDLDIFMDSVNPGVVKEARVIFTVADDAEGFVFHGGDLGFWDEDTTEIDLGF